MKKLLSTIMAVVMLLSLVPMAVAEEGVAAGNAVARIGDQYYETLADAVAVVPLDGTETTITLVRDAAGDGVVVDAGKNVIFDFDGHTYTLKGKAVGSTNTKTNGFQLLKGSVVVFKNGTVNIDASNLTKITDETSTKDPKTCNNFMRMIQSYAKVTIEDMTFDATNQFGGKDYVMSFNHDVVNIIGNTNIIGETGKVVFDSDNGEWGGYDKTEPLTKVTVNTTGKIVGDIEVTKGGLNIQNVTLIGGIKLGSTQTPVERIAVSGGAFTDLASAVKYAADGATITLAGDAKGDIVIPAGKTITLDLGGHKLTNVKDHTIVNNGTLTITGTGTVDNVTHGKAALYNKGAATLNGGTFERSTEAGVDSKNNGGNSFYTILNHGVMTVNKGVVVNNKGHYSSLFENGYYSYNNRDGVENPSLIINDGTFDGGLNTIKNDDNATLVIENGTFKNYTQACVQNHHVAEIRGGEYIGNKAAAVLMCGACNTVDETHDRHVMSIIGGNFKGDLTVNVGKLTIKGGTFTVNPSAFVADTNLVVVPNVGKTEYTVQPKTSEDGTVTKVEGNTKTETKTDGNTKTETKTDLVTGATTETKTETKVEGNVTTKTETVTEKNAAGETTKVTESKIVENNENGKTETKTTVDGKTVKTDVTVNQAPATASDVTLNAKALEGKAAGTETSSVAVDKASLSELKNNTVKGVIIETDQATLKLDKTAVKTMEGKVAADGKMTLNVTVTEETNASKTEIEKIMVEVTAKNEAGENVFPENTANTNGLINITIPYNGNATQLDLWYIAANGSASYMGRFPVVKGFVSFDVKHFSQYDLIPVASSGSSVIKTGAGSSAASTTQTVTTDLTPGSITKVTVDGKVVDAKYYTVSGSNVTFTAEFLKTLKNGSHTVTVENATKIAKGVFTVNNPTTAVQAPTTADAGIALYAGMAIASVMGTGVVFTSRKRKNH